MAPHASTAASLARRVVQPGARRVTLVPLAACQVRKEACCLLGTRKHGQGQRAKLVWGCCGGGGGPPAATRRKEVSNGRRMPFGAQAHRCLLGRREGRRSQLNTRSPATSRRPASRQPPEEAGCRRPASASLPPLLPVPQLLVEPPQLVLLSIAAAAVCADAVMGGVFGGGGGGGSMGQRGATQGRAHSVCLASSSTHSAPFPNSLPTHPSPTCWAPRTRLLPPPAVLARGQLPPVALQPPLLLALLLLLLLLVAADAERRGRGGGGG